MSADLIATLVVVGAILAIWLWYAKASSSPSSNFFLWLTCFEHDFEYEERTYYDREIEETYTFSRSTCKRCGHVARE